MKIPKRISQKPYKNSIKILSKFYQKSYKNLKKKSLHPSPLPSNLSNRFLSKKKYIYKYFHRI